ncbi:MAG: ABC transporter substrate binding protein, partial [Gemmatimonadota bacterium]|nr:ABC transporter substrate binding protein [Gemmatimonadota bacterium]
GCLVAQYQGFADIGMGIGTVVIGLAAVIIGESVLRIRSIYGKILSVIIGSVIFRFMIAVALYVGMNPIDLKLLTAVFVLLTLIVTKAAGSGKAGKRPMIELVKQSLAGRKLQLAAAGLVVIIIAAAIGYNKFISKPAGTDKTIKIGFLQVSDNGLLNITRDSFVKEMERIGYRDGENCRIMLENANGELPTVNTILDKFLFEDVDIVVPISTSCTQATVNKIKDRPVVFATVANPFIIKAGTSETEHLPNVTGVYGWAPMDETLAIVRKIVPGKLKVGAIWDPAHANSVFNAGNLEKACESDDDIEFFGTTISSSSEVYQAALSLVNKKIDVFVLPPDNIVYSAFESVVKAAGFRDIPVFLCDVARLGDGALGAYGYDYTISGIQAAHLVDRILKGESPEGIPFERYRKITFGLNLEVARKLGIELPDDLMAKATDFHGLTDEDKARLEKLKGPGMMSQAQEPSEEPEKKLALFLFNENLATSEAVDGLVDELRKSGILERKNITVDRKNAQNEFAMAQSIAQDIVRRDYDYVITLCTPVLQATAKANKNIPHVFSFVTDPYRAGVAQSPEDHPPNLTGLQMLDPVEFTIQAIRELFPAAKRIGIVWNPAESNSETCTVAAREAAKKYGFELLEATVSTTSEVMDAVKSLFSRKIDILFTSGDNIVTTSILSICKLTKKARIPYFTNNPSDVTRGCLVAIGADYYEVGRETAKLVSRVLNGENPKDIPIRNFMPKQINVNLDLAQELGITLPEPFLKKAVKAVVGGKLVELEKADEGRETADSQPKKLAMFVFSDHVILELIAKGVTDELHESGTLEKNNISIDYKNSQGDYGMGQAIVQDMVRQKYDYIVSITTQALQMTANGNKKIPHIFGGVTDPIRAGAATSLEDHQ